MSVVIDLGAEREKRSKPSGPETGGWALSVDVYASGEGENQASGIITAFNDEDGLEVAERLRVWATHLEQLALTLRQNAHSIEADEKGRVLATAIVWESSHVRTWISEDIETPEQRDWLKRQLSQAAQEG